MTNASPTMGTWYHLQPVVPDPRHSRPSSDPHVDQCWTAIIDKLLLIRGYRDDWDGEGSLAPKPDIVDATINLIQAMRVSGESPPVGASCTDEGTVVVEWQLPNGSRNVEMINSHEAEIIWIPKGSGQAVQTRYLLKD